MAAVDAMMTSLARWLTKRLVAARVCGASMYWNELCDQQLK